MDSNAARSEIYETSTIVYADKPPLTTPICYFMNQVENLQNHGIYTFAAHFEADEFIQKIINIQYTE